jgi:hypothetical protein
VRSILSGHTTVASRSGAARLSISRAVFLNFRRTHAIRYQ